MVALKTVYNNTHKYLKNEMAEDFERFADKYDGAKIFEQTQALIFMAINGHEPKDKHKDTLKELIDAYNHIPDFRDLVDKGLDHLHEAYKNETIDLDDKTAQGDKYFKQVKEQLRYGEMDFSVLGTPKKLDQNQEEFTK